MSGVLNLLGFHIGRPAVLMPPNEDNPKGYWEHQLLTNLNDEILSRLGGNWHTPPKFSPGWEEAPELEDLRQRARLLIQEEFGPHEFWSWKDPRNCLLLPFWQPLLPPVRYIVSLRNPVEVAKSLMRRDGFSLEKSVELWLVHVKSALVHSEHHPRLLVWYEDLLAHPDAELRRIGRFLGKTELVEMESTRRAVREFIDKELRHNQADVMDIVNETGLPYEEKSFYTLLQLIGNKLKAGEGANGSDGQLNHILNRLGESAWAAHAGFKDKLAELEVAAGRRAELEGQLRAQQSESRRLKGELQAQQNENRRLNEVVKSAEQWQTFWFRRIFNRWHPPGASREKIGFMRKLERSIRKRRKRFFSLFFSQNKSNATNEARSSQANKEKVGVFKELERSIRKRRKHLLGRSCKNYHPDDDAVEDFLPQVTVIVPNFNHAAYLRKRLESIYQQTYKNFNVLLLDDCSQDGSMEILNEYASKYPAITKIIRNQSNGSTPFKQWKRGIQEAEGDLLWIAESDDFCDANFLETLVPFFKDSAMALAFCRTDFVDEWGGVTQMTYPQYVQEFGAEKWAQDYVETAHNIVNEVLGIKNIIPNASGVLFKKPRHLKLLEEPAWLQMKICGDWIFYLHIIQGGKVGFSGKTMNYYRLHDNNASAYKRHRQPFYFKEHETVAKTVARLYKVNSSLFDQSYESLKRYWGLVWQGASLPDWTLDDQFKINDIKSEQAKRPPNILIACHDFGGGGGEMFPIRLANELHEQGKSVVFYDFNGLPSNPEFKKNLSPNIPLIRGNNDVSSISRHISEFGIDIVHTHHLTVDLYFSRAISLLKNQGQPGPKQIVTLHGMYEISADLFKKCQHELIQASDHWIYTADKNLESFKNAGCYESESEKFTKIPLAVKIEPARSLERHCFNLPADAFIVCVASRAIPEKGWEESIEAIGLARSKSGRNIHLLLAGEGPVKSALSQRTLPPYIHLLGYQNEIVSLYAMSDIGLLASNYKGESCPLTIIECLSAGKPVVATAIGEIPAMLTLAPEKPAGILIELADWQLPVAKLAEAICLYATDETAYRHAAANCLESAKRYSIDLITQKYGQIYDSIFRGRNPATR